MNKTTQTPLQQGNLYSVVFFALFEHVWITNILIDYGVIHINCLYIHTFYGKRIYPIYNAGEWEGGSWQNDESIKKD